MLRKPLAVLACASMLASCASSVMPSRPPEPPCRALVEPTDGTVTALLRWATEVIYDYRDCADRFEKLNGR